jgi:phosphopantetheinyl transferase (holo-ACP synthase)
VVGNDIIDIEETKRSTNWERPRFLQKVFTTQEQSLIRASADSFTCVWQLWSMKESAYKVFTQAGGMRFLDPTKIECNLESLKKGKVKIDTITMETSTVFHSNYILSSAIINNSYIDTCVFDLPEGKGIQQSTFMQEQVLIDFAKNNSLNLADLQVQKTNAGIPIIHYKNKALKNALSITHHGEYGAYSIVADNKMN